MGQRGAAKTYITNTGVSQDKLRLVLIGNGLAGMRCLEDLLDMAPDRYEVTVIGEEPWGNYNRIMLSRFYRVRKPLKILCCIHRSGTTIKALNLLLVIKP